MNVTSSLSNLFFWKPTIDQRNPAYANDIQSTETEAAPLSMYDPLKERMTTSVSSRVLGIISAIKVISFSAMASLGIVNAPIRLAQVYLEIEDLDKALDCLKLLGFVLLERGEVYDKKRFELACLELGEGLLKNKDLNRALDCLELLERAEVYDKKRFELACLELVERFLKIKDLDGNRALWLLRSLEGAGVHEKKRFELACFELGGKFLVDLELDGALDCFKKESQIEDHSSEQDVLNSPFDNLSPIEKLPPELLAKIISFLPTNIQKARSSLLERVKKEMRSYYALGGLSRTFYHIVRDPLVHRGFLQTLQGKIRSLYPDFPEVFSLDLKISKLVTTFFRGENVSKYEIVTPENRVPTTTLATSCYIRLNLESIAIRTPLHLIKIKTSSSLDILVLAEKLINDLGFTFTSASIPNASTAYYGISELNSSGSVRKLESRNVGVEGIEKGSQMVIVPEGGFSLYEAPASVGGKN